MTSGKKYRIHIKQAAGVLTSVLLAALFLYIALYNVDFYNVLQIISGASILWIIVFILIQFTSHYLRALRWKIILDSVKPDASVTNLFGSLMVGYGVNCVIPRFGEISRAVLLGRWEGISRSSLLGSVILERIIDIIVILLAILISVLIWSGNLYESFPWLKSSLYIAAFLMVLIIILFLLLIEMKQRFTKLIIRLISKISEKLAHKAAYIFDMLLLGFVSLKGRKNYVLTLLLSVLIVLSYALSSYAGFYILGMQEIGKVNYGMAWVLMSLSAIGVIIPTPGGTGSYHALAKSVLVLLFGFGEELSVAYAFITHTISYFLFLITAVIIFFWLDNRYYKHSGRHEKLTDLFVTEQDNI